MTYILQFPAPVAIVGASVVEFLGLSTVITATQFWDWNDSKRKTDQGAPFWIAITAGAFYLAIIITINVLLDSSTFLLRLSKALLSLLSIVAAVVIAIRSQHARRMALVEAEKQEKRQLRQERQEVKTPVKRAARSRKDKPPGDKSPVDWRTLSLTERQTLHGLSTAEIKAIFPGISDRTARDWKKRANL
jgi:Mn2+/Fe2+ NRAMP family transporter